MEEFLRLDKLVSELEQNIGQSNRDTSQVQIPEIFCDSEEDFPRLETLKMLAESAAGLEEDYGSHELDRAGPSNPLRTSSFFEEHGRTMMGTLDLQSSRVPKAMERARGDKQSPEAITRLSTHSEDPNHARTKRIAVEEMTRIAALNLEKPTRTAKGNPGTRHIPQLPERIALPPCSGPIPAGSGSSSSAAAEKNHAP
jgi:hypothetical protein